MIEENKEKESKPEAETTEEVKPEAETSEESKPEAETTEEVKSEAETTEESKPEAETSEGSKLEAETTEEVKPEAETNEESKPEAEASEESKTEAQLEKVLNFDEFRPGDNITVNIKIVEGDRQRTQSFQGDVIKGRFIKSKNPDKASTFLIRRIASGVGVERIFPFFSPSIESIKLNRKGKVRQARIYYMRERAGKRARIKERRN